jgi:hypothetical protein
MEHNKGQEYYYYPQPGQPVAEGYAYPPPPQQIVYAAPPPAPVVVVKKHHHHRRVLSIEGWICVVFLLLVFWPLAWVPCVVYVFLSYMSLLLLFFFFFFFFFFFPPSYTFFPLSDSCYEDRHHD